VPTRTKKLAAPPTWNQIVHDLGGDLAAHKLLLTAIGMATDAAERSGHLEMAKQLLTLGESRLKSLRQAVQQELAKAPTASSQTVAKTGTPQANGERPKVPRRDSARRKSKS